MTGKVPKFIQDYMDALELMTAWCIQRAKKGDVTVQQLAQKFAENIIKKAGENAKENLQ